MNSTERNLVELLYQALAEPIGLLIQTNDAHWVRHKFLQARRNWGDPALDAIQTVPLEDDQLMLVNRTAKGNDGKSAEELGI